jgi:hypothetical protein
MISGIWTKYLLNKFRKVDLAVPSAHPWLSRNMAIGYDEMK